MAKPKLLSLLAILIMVVSALVLAPPFVGVANAAVVINAPTPSTAHVGDSVTITGNGFTSGDSISVMFGATPALVTSGGTVSGTTISVTATVPAMPRGVYDTKVTTATTGQITLAGSLTVGPNVTVSPATGTVSTSVTVNGTGFGANESSIQVMLDGTSTILTSGIFASPTGSWSSAFSVPFTTGGAHVVWAGGISGGTTAFAGPSFTVTPTVTISPASGAIGTQVSASGNGFKANETITLKWDGSVLTLISPASLIADVNGQWSGATFAVPTTSGGSHSILATGSSGSISPAVTFNTPSLTLTPGSGAVGSVVKVTGAGFRPYETGIYVTWGIYSQVVPTTPAAITVDATGAWSATFVVPTGTTLGTYTVNAIGSQTYSGSVVTPPTFSVVAGIGVNPQSGKVGTVVTVTGTGFPSYQSNIFLTWNGSTLGVPGSITADYTGSFTTYFTVTAAPAGTYSVSTINPTLTSVNFQITPSITMSPASGPPGASVTMTGSGFQAGEAGITISFDGVPVAASFVTYTGTNSADFYGNWSAVFSVPTYSTGGPHSVVAYGASTTAASLTVQVFNVVGLTISLSSGAAGTVVSVTGIGFAANETGISVLWDGVAIQTGITASAGGAWTANATIPNASGGNHQIGAQGSATIASSVPAQTFNVTPTFNVQVASAKPGDSVTVSGNGFRASEAGVLVTWDGTALPTTPAAVAVNVNGGWSATIVVPNTPGGSHSVSSYGSVTASGSTPAVNVTVTPNFKVSGTSGIVGSPVTVNGYGFAANESGIQVMWGGVAVKSGLVADSTGTWSVAMTVPENPRGDYTVGAQGPSTSYSSVPAKNFTVQPSLAISPTSGWAGIVVNATGTGFSASFPVVVSFNSSVVATNPANVTTSASGNLNASFSAPLIGPGAYTVTFRDNIGTLSATFTITSSVGITVNSGTVGSQTTITGLGYQPATPVTLTYDNSPIATTPASITTDTTGAFSAAITIPESARGAHSIKTTAGVTVLSVSFSVTPKMTISPDTGPVGTSVTMTGSGFGSGQNITFLFDSFALSSTPATVTASSNGSFTATALLPGLAGGAHVLKSSDQAASAQVNATITAKASASPGAVKVGDTVNASGNGYPANGAIQVTVDGSAVTTSPAPVSADANGNFSLSFKVPAGVFGNHTATYSSGAATSQVAYSISSTFSISPDNGHVGSDVVLSGTGFAGSSAITATYDGSPLAITPSTSNAQGSFQGTVTVPKSIHGPHTIVARDSANPSLQAIFTMESTSPPVPSPASPPNASRLGVFGPKAPTFQWDAVTDPSGVVYSLEVAKDPGFSQLVINQTNLTAASYAMVLESGTAAAKLGQGYYYWRVKAIDGASNESTWSQTFKLKIGWVVWMPLWLFILFIVIVLAIIGGAVYWFGFAQKKNRV